MTYPARSGVLSALAGIMIFNIGLTNGISRLGKEGGEALPTAFMDVHGQPPIYPYTKVRGHCRAGWCRVVGGVG